MTREEVVTESEQKAITIFTGLVDKAESRLQFKLDEYDKVRKEELQVLEGRIFKIVALATVAWIGLVVTNVSLLYSRTDDVVTNPRLKAEVGEVKQWFGEETSKLRYPWLQDKGVVEGEIRVNALKISHLEGQISRLADKLDRNNSDSAKRHEELKEWILQITGRYPAKTGKETQ